MSQYENKSALLNLKRVKHGVDTKGRNYSKISFDQQTAVTLLEELTKNIENPRGVTLSVFFTKQQTKDGSREFDSGFVFCDGIQEPRQGGYAGNAAAPTQFRRTGGAPTSKAPVTATISTGAPAAPSAGSSLKDRIAKVKAGNG